MDTIYEQLFQSLIMGKETKIPAESNIVSIRASWNKYRKNIPPLVNRKIHFVLVENSYKVFLSTQAQSKFNFTSE